MAPSSGERPGGLHGRRLRSTAGDLSRIGTGSRTRGTLERGGRGAPFLFPALLALLAAGGVWFGRGALASCGASLASTDTQIVRALAAQGRAQLDDVYGFHGGGTVELHALRFGDVATSVEGGRATVVAMLTAEGRAVWRDQQAGLSYLGRERFHMRPCRIAGWCGEGDQFERLRGVLLALFRHRDAADRGDVEGLARLVAPTYEDAGEDRAALLRRSGGELAASAPAGAARVRAWQIRVERDTAEVGEDLSLPQGDGGGRPGRKVYRLVRAEGRWLFAAGL